MGLLGKLLGNQPAKPTLVEDIPKAEQWIIEAMASSGYQLGGTWETDDGDPMGEVNAAVHLADGSTVWPVQRAMKRFQNGSEDSLYAYGAVLSRNGHTNQR